MTFVTAHTRGRHVVCWTTYRPPPLSSTRASSRAGAALLLNGASMIVKCIRTEGGSVVVLWQLGSGGKKLTEARLRGNCLSRSYQRRPSGCTVYDAHGEAGVPLSIHGSHPPRTIPAGTAYCNMCNYYFLRFLDLRNRLQVERVLL